MRTCCILSLFSLVVSVSHAETDYSSVLEQQNSLQFMKNQGQFDPAIAYKSHYGSISLAFLQNHDLSYCISRELEGLPEEQQDTLPDFLKDKEHDKPKPKEYLTWNQTWLNSNKNAKVYELQHSKSKCNYFLGNDQSKWVKNADQYAALKYEGVYPHIDAHYYSKDNKFKYDYVVTPGGKVADIQVSYQGIKKLSINEQGQLIIQTAWGDFTEEAPFSYLKETKEEIAVAYHIINDSTFGFKASKYDKNQSLIIDPYSLCWSTFLGGAGNYYSRALEILPSGEPIVVGYCDNTHPITPGAFQTVYGGGTRDVFVSKLSSDGSNLIFSTFLGGNSTDFFGFMEVTPLGEIIVSGQTNSSNFPTSTGASQTTWGGLQDIFISKLNNSGTNLIFSTFLGGNNDEYLSFMEVSPLGEIIVTGSTFSSNFPTTPGAFQTTWGGGLIDVFISKLNSSGTNLVFSTFLGGNSDEVPILLELSTLGDVLVTGQTTSSNFPTSIGASQTTWGGQDDVFISKLSSNGSSLIFSTLLGGNDLDRPVFMEVNPLGEIIVAGYTASSNFPITPGAFQTTLGGGIQNIFISKLNNSGTNLIFSTFLGGNSDEYLSFMEVSPLGEIIVVGYTESSNFPTTPGAFQTTWGGIQDVFISKLSSNGTNLVFSTFFGGNDADSPVFIEVNPLGGIIVAGYTASSNFPTTPGAFQTTWGGGLIDVFISKLNSSGTNLIFSTFWGGNGSEYLSFMEVNPLEEIMVVGYTGSSNFPTTPGAFQTNWGGQDDVFISKLSSNGANLFSTFLGGNAADYSLDNKVKLIGCNLYMSPTVHSMNFPVTSGAFQTNKANNGDTPVVLKMSMCDDIDPNLLQDSSNCTINQIPFPAPLDSGMWSDGSQVDTFWVNAPGVYWFEADSGCGMMYRDSFEVSIGSVASFAIADTAVCVDALVNAPIAGGTWYDGSTSSPITINQEGAFWYEYYDATCDTTLRDSFTVSLHHPVPFQIPDTNACEQLSLNTPIPGGVWSTGINTSPIIITTEGEYWFEFTDTCNITLRDSFMVDLGTLLKQDISDFIMCQGKIETIIPQVPGGVWSDGSSDGFYSISTSGNYWYVYDDGCGNSVKDEFIASTINCDTITCKPPYFYIPNTFTPDLNDLNESFGPSLGNCIEFFEFMVFDRWGELLFKTNSPNERWNGYYLEVLAQEDVYVWKMTYKLINTRYFEEYGHVTVLR
jgi:gliding motility-associated-like protein